MTVAVIVEAEADRAAPAAVVGWTPAALTVRMVFQDRFSLATSGHRDLHDITEQVATIVQRSGLRTGLVHIFNVGSTGGRRRH